MKEVRAVDMMRCMGESVVLACIVIVTVGMMYLGLEPVISHSAGTTSGSFTMTQQVTSEISFVVAASNVTMSPSLPGVTGGTASGTVTVRVLTNDANGYNMTLQASGSPAMRGVLQGGSIPNYTPAANVPDFSFTIANNTAEFGYTVSASTTSDLATPFKDNASNACGIAAGADTNYSASCWFAASTTATTTINRSTKTPDSGATTTLIFRTTITSNPTPGVIEDVYMATTTLTALVN